MVWLLTKENCFSKTIEGVQLLKNLLSRTKRLEVLPEMFRLLCWFSLATFPSVHANCWFAGETRNTKDTCYGAVSRLSPGMARAANVPEGTPTCLGHRRSIEREDNRCSWPLLEKHSKTLTDNPASLCAVLNSRGENKENYCSGSKWCHACKRKFYKEAGTTDVNKTRKVNLISVFPFVNKFMLLFP